MFEQKQMKLLISSIFNLYFLSLFLHHKVTLKQRENEIANLKSRLLNEMNKKPSKRLVYNMIGEECEDVEINEIS